MKKLTISPALRFALVTVWRLALLAAVIIALACVGLYMTLQAVLCGPSEAARDQLTLTLLESPVTQKIPGYFLDEAAIDAICAVEDTLSADVSDPSLITAAPEIAGQTVDTVEGGTYTAQVTLTANADITFAGSMNYAGFNADGVLVLTSSAEQAQALGLQGGCGHILLLNGQANEGLFAAESGFAPRTAVGQRSDGTLILVTTDGWTREHPGATWRDLINIMTHYGAVNACVIGNEGSAWNRN